MKTLLVPTDFSPEADAGIEYAAAVSLEGSYHLLLLHAFYLSTVNVLYNQIAAATSAFRDAARNNLAAEKDSLSGRLLSPPECFFEESDLGTAIQKILHERKVDLIIMGTRGAKGLKRLFSGSHTSAIIRNADCPVISVPGNTKFQGFKRVAFATNYHREDIDELCSLIELTSPFQAVITVVHITKTDEDRASALMTAFERNVRGRSRYPFLVFRVLRGTTLLDTLHNYLETKRPDLFAISTRKRLTIERLAGPGLSETLSLESRFPVLVFHQATAPLIF